VERIRYAYAARTNYLPQWFGTVPRLGPGLEA
jgi:hypothetical protein